jgi:hypothetical protein
MKGFSMSDPFFARLGVPMRGPKITRELCPRDWANPARTPQAIQVGGLDAQFAVMSVENPDSPGLCRHDWLFRSNLCPSRLPAALG